MGAPFRIKLMGWTPLDGIAMCQGGGCCNRPERGASMVEVSTIGVDLTKNVFQVHGADVSGAIVFRRKLRRHDVLGFFAAQPRCVVAMEACGGAHYWGREIGRLGHEVKLIAPAYVKPFVKRQKNDVADAEARAFGCQLESKAILKSGWK
jgi:hypothetical protein